MPIIFALFLVVPILEMWLLIRVGAWIGAWQTIALVALTAVIGINLLRQQGLNTLLRANQRLESGQIPAQELMEGLLLAVGGALLLTPGFVTDGFGFMCLLPPSRKLLISRILKHVKFSAVAPGMGAAGGFSESSERPQPSATERQGSVIEGEFQRKD